MLKIENLKKCYKNHIVFNRLSLTINDGDLIYIHGINGSGKSTLFKIICGITNQNDGIIIKDGNTHLIPTGQMDPA